MGYLVYFLKLNPSFQFVFVSTEPDFKKIFRFIAINL